MTTRKLLSAALLTASLAAAGCGETTPTVSTCPQNGSYLGCSLVGHATARATAGAARFTPPGPKFPDVSSYQGHPNWDAAKASGIAGAGVKAGEYREDPDFAYNVAQLNRLHLPWVPYWFVRNTGCQREGQQIVDVVRSVGGLTSGPVALDMEVPEARGYAPCLDAAVYAVFHRHAVIYTAPGTWPGGSNAGLGLWVADYGPTQPPCFWTCHPLAWQETNGRNGFPIHVPGIGTGDVNVNYGLLAPARRICFGSGSTPGDPICARVRAQVASWQRAGASSQRAYGKRGCPVLAQRVTWFSRVLRLHPRGAKAASRRRALDASRKWYGREACGVFAQRSGYFAAQVRALTARYA